MNESVFCSDRGFRRLVNTDPVGVPGSVIGSAPSSVSVSPPSRSGDDCLDVRTGVIVPGVPGRTGPVSRKPFSHWVDYREVDSKSISSDRHSSRDRL